jgi:hypothetical protein
VSHAQQVWAYVVTDVTISGLALAGLALLAVTVARWIARTRRRPRN